MSSPPPQITVTSVTPWSARNPSVALAFDESARAAITHDFAAPYPPVPSRNAGGWGGESPQASSPAEDTGSTQEDAPIAAVAANVSGHQDIRRIGGSSLYTPILW